jgi:hypothetical protein
VVAQGAGPLNQIMTPEEGLVLVVAAVLLAAVFVEGIKGTLTRWVGALLMSLAMLAAVAAFAHMGGR